MQDISEADINSYNRKKIAAKYAALTILSGTAFAVALPVCKFIIKQGTEHINIDPEHVKAIAACTSIPIAVISMYSGVLALALVGNTLRRVGRKPSISTVNNKED